LAEWLARDGDNDAVELDQAVLRGHAVWAQE
jgi:hypothetical protein